MHASSRRMCGFSVFLVILLSVTAVNTREHVLSTPHVSDCIDFFSNCWLFFLLTAECHHANVSHPTKVNGKDFLKKKKSLGLHHYTLEVPTSRCQCIIFDRKWVFSVRCNCGVVFWMCNRVMWTWSLYIDHYCLY